MHDKIFACCGVNSFCWILNVHDTRDIVVVHIIKNLEMLPQKMRLCISVCVTVMFPLTLGCTLINVSAL